uniref:ubiquitinyl hydrolase 1 n=1 Tax=Salmo trutta TaxID=8032 RepID=A0A673WWS0_SALTR
MDQCLAVTSVVTALNPSPSTMLKANTKEKKSFSKKLFRRGSVRSVGSFMNRVLRTLSTLSHFGNEEHEDEEKDDASFIQATTGGSVPSDDSECGGFLFGDKVPGVAGLKNHGNTCFMNAILQCLSNTELFAEYLALEQYRGEDSCHSTNDKSTESNKPNSANGVCIQRKGHQQESGEVTEQLSGLVRALWTFEYNPQHSQDFKNVVSKSALQFRGNAQHDAQEFLLWLLDRVHEDLNNIVLPSSRPPRKPLLEDENVPEGSSLPVACGSFIQELFQAQYRSSLTCPHCQKQSNTFDPFLCISLPIPVPHTRPLYVTVVYQGKCSHCMTVGVAVPLSSTVSGLRKAVAQETKIPSEQIVLTEMYSDGFHRSFCDDDDDLEIIQESDSIFAFETPELFRPEQIRSKRGSPHANLNQNNIKYGTYNNSIQVSTKIEESVIPPPSPSKNSGADKIILLVCNRACSGQQGRRFGHPFVLYLERTVTWDVLQKEILEKMLHLLHPEVFVQVGPFSLRVVGVVGITYLLPQEEQPLCHPSVERAYKSCGPGGPPHVKIVVEWDKETKDYLFKRTEDEYIPDAESVRQQKDGHLQPQSCSLAQCFQLYTREEQLAPDDAWRCPHCKQLQQGSIKLSLWTLPDILILHLKRFRQDGDRRMKMQNMVKFPVIGMDMAPHMVKRSQSSWSLPSHWSPWRRPYGMGRDPEDYLYDLYAVCNHHGTMAGGHYTAHCKNSIDGMWYCFDDSDVQAISDDEVCKQNAYILFYQRRATIPSWSANSSVAGSTSSSLCEHWISRLMGSHPPSQASSGSSRRTSLASLSESTEYTGERSEDDGGFTTRPAMRSIQRQTFSLRSNMASPLAISENSSKPSWSLSAKLHLRSNLPSHFSLDSHSSSPTLERIGEAADDKVSTSCFSGSTKPEVKFGGKTPLVVVEGNAGAKRLLEQVLSKPVPQAKPRSSSLSPKNRPPPHLPHPTPPLLPTHRRLLEPKPRAWRPQHPTPKKKARMQSPKPARPPPPKQPPPPKRSPCRPQRRCTPKPQNKRRATSPRGTAERSSASVRTRAAERSASRETSRNTSVSERGLNNGGSSSTASGVSRGGERGVAGRGESRAGQGPECRAGGRSTSSISSMTSLRSSSLGVAPAAEPSRGSQRNSKTEEKGVNFFKSALRQKETRKSTDRGKPTTTAKAGTGEAKGSLEEGPGRGTGEGAGDGATKRAQQGNPKAQMNTPTAKDKESSKTLTPAKHSILSSAKSKSSGSEMGVAEKSSANGKKPPEKKLLPSRKIPINSTRTTQKPK